MCMFGGGTPTPPPVQMPKETQAMQEPDGGTVNLAARRKTTDRLRAAAATTLTGGMGDPNAGLTPTAGKTMLGG